MANLCINIDHIATLRQARLTVEPELLLGAYLAELQGVSGITIHLREDERHIQKKDVYLIKENIKTKLNLESSLHPDIVKVVLDVKPHTACIVPEKREEVTTEGGLNVFKETDYLYSIIHSYQKNSILVSLFIDANKEAILKAKELGVEMIEINTGAYANATTEREKKDLLRSIFDSVELASSLNLSVNLGHGLTYHNIFPFVDNPKIDEFNIGHSIISRSIFVGLPNAIEEMKKIIKKR